MSNNTPEYEYVIATLCLRVLCKIGSEADYDAPVKIHCVHIFVCMHQWLLSGASLFHGILLVAMVEKFLSTLL